MKIIWAIPDFAEPKTGGEKFYHQLKRSFESRAAFLRTKKFDFFPPSGAIGFVRSNRINFDALFPQDRGAVILEEFSYRRCFLLTNIILALFFRRRYILFVHECFDRAGLSWFGTRIRKNINRVIFGLAYKIIINSQSTFDWVNRFGSFEKKCFIFYPILKGSPDDEKPARGRVGVPKNLLCVANIRRNKGQVYLLRAMARLKNKNVRLKLVGLVKDDAYDQELRQEIKEIGLRDRVDFMGFLGGDELTDVYKEADIFVLPTLKEGFGMALVEAMSFGLPVIASRVGGIPEIVRDGIEGVLVPPASSEDLAQAIESLIENEDLRQRYSSNALVRYRSMPSWEKLFEDFYRFLSP